MCGSMCASNFIDCLLCSVKDVLQTQVNVQCGLWRGRVHFTMAADSLEEVNISTKSLALSGVVSHRVQCLCNSSSRVEM